MLYSRVESVSQDSCVAQASIGTTSKRKFRRIRGSDRPRRRQEMRLILGEEGDDQSIVSQWLKGGNKINKE